MIYLGKAHKSVLKKADIYDIERDLSDIREVARELPDDKETDVANKISEVEFIIQRGRKE